MVVEKNFFSMKLGSSAFYLKSLGDMSKEICDGVSIDEGKYAEPEPHDSNQEHAEVGHKGDIFHYPHEKLLHCDTD